MDVVVASMMGKWPGKGRWWRWERWELKEKRVKGGAEAEVIIGGGGKDMCACVCVCVLGEVGS